MRTPLLLLGLVVLLAVPAPTTAAGLRPVDSSTGALVTDGARSVAYVAPGGTLTVVRTDGQTTRSPLPPSCVLVDVTGATVLLGCTPAPPNVTDGAHVPVLYDSEAGTYAAPPNLVSGEGFLAAPGDRGGISLDRLGTAWIVGYRTDYAGAGDQTAIWLERSPVRPAVVSLDDRRVEDLDRPARTRPLCAPLRVPDVRGVDGQPARAPYTYVKPWSLTFNATVEPVVQRCGQRRPTKVACDECTGITLAGHRLAWNEGGRLVVRDLTRHVTRSWRLPAGNATAAVTLTRDAAFVVTAARPGTPTRTLLRVDLG